MTLANSFRPSALGQSFLADLDAEPNGLTVQTNYAGHIWDYPDAQGKRGATACIVVPWLVDHIEKGGSWTAMVWWIHDHLSYSRLYFFPNLAAFNINWHEAPVRRIDSYAPPRGCLTQPGMPNHGGSHAIEYAGFPTLVKRARATHAVALRLGSKRQRGNVKRPKWGRAPSERRFLSDSGQTENFGKQPSSASSRRWPPAVSGQVQRR